MALASAHSLRRGAPRPPPSAANLETLYKANALDIALYAYAAERFDAHFTACFPYRRAKNRFRFRRRSPTAHPPAFESALRTAAAPAATPPL